jgi:hypothetical protein
MVTTGGSGRHWVRGKGCKSTGRAGMIIGVALTNRPALIESANALGLRS